MILSELRTCVSFLRYDILITIVCGPPLLKSHRGCGRGRGGGGGVCRCCPCRYPHLGPAMVSLLDSSQNTNDDTHTVVVPWLELGGAVESVSPEDTVPVIQLVCGYVVVLREYRTKLASFCFRKLVTIRTDFASSRIQEVRASWRWFDTSAGGTMNGSRNIGTVKITVPTVPKLCRTTISVGVTKGPVPGGKLCNVDILRHVVAYIAGIGICKTTAIFGSTYLCLGNNKILGWRAIGSGRTIRIGIMSQTPFLLSAFFGIRATHGLRHNVTALERSALSVRERRKFATGKLNPLPPTDVDNIIVLLQEVI